MSSPNGSFIPNNPAQTRGGAKRRPKKLYLISYAVYLLFVTSLITAAGLWVYGFVLGNSYAEAQSDLVAEQQKFDSVTLQSVLTADKKLQHTRTLLEETINIAALLDEIEAVLLANVQITSFQYENSDKELRLSLSTSLPDFNAALYQRSVISRSQYFSTASIENVLYERSTSAEAAGGGAVTSLTYDIVLALDESAFSITNTALTAPSTNSVEEEVDSTDTSTSSEAVTSEVTSEIDT